MVLGIIRTSTIYQEIQSQKDELEKFIQNDTSEEYVIIGKQGASAIKLDDAYLENLQQVYDYINTGNVTCIYAFALDRIGRNEEVMMKFKNTLIEKKIQLKIMNPTLYLLDSNGLVNSGMEIAFSLFITMAKQEMLTKKARFIRGKARNGREGKYIGGFVPFGYYIDDDGYYRINEKEAELVRWIYTTYAEGEHQHKGQKKPEKVEKRKGKNQKPQRKNQKQRKNKESKQTVKEQCKSCSFFYAYS